MAVVTKSIGTTARDYATITLWEAALNGAAGGGGNDAVGECYDDSAFDELPVIDDGTPDNIKLTVPEAERHDGTEGSGARIVTTGGSVYFIDFNSAKPCELEWLEFDSNGQFIRVGVHNRGSTLKTRNVIVHDQDEDNRPIAGILYAAGGGGDILNCFIYNLTTTQTDDIVLGISYDETETGNIMNNTVHDMIGPAGSAVAVHGISFTDDADVTVKNNIVTDTINGSPNADYSPASPGNAAADYNLSSDASASDDGGGNVEINKTSANQFVSNSAPYDLHIKTGADAIGAGVDLGTTPTGVEIDIDGRDRDAEGDIWDMGAHEFVAVGGAVMAAHYYRTLLQGGRV